MGTGEEEAMGKKKKTAASKPASSPKNPRPGVLSRETPLEQEIEQAAPHAEATELQQQLMEPDGAEGADGIATHCDQSANSMKKESLNPEMEDHLNGLDVSPEKVRAVAMALTENGFYSPAQLTKEIAYLDSVLKDFPSMDQIKIKRHHQGEAEAAKLKAAEVTAEAAKAKMAKMVGCKQGGHIPDDELVMEHHPEKLQFAAVYTVDGIEYGHLEYTLRGSDPDVCEPVTISSTMLGKDLMDKLIEACFDWALENEIKVLPRLRCIREDHIKRHPEREAQFKL